MNVLTQFGESLVREVPEEVPGPEFKIDDETLAVIEMIEQNARTAVHRLRFVVMD